MKAIFTALILFCLLHLHLNAADPVFEHLENKDYKKLKQHLIKSKSWRIATNDKDETPLSVAIKAKDIIGVEILCLYGANINDESNNKLPIELAIENDVNIALLLLTYPEIKITDELIIKIVNKLFNIDFENKIATCKRKIDLDNKDYFIPKELLLKVNKVSNLGVTDLFISRIELAKLIFELYRQKYLSKNELDNILEHFAELFLQDQSLKKNTLVKIVTILFPLRQNRNLLRLILTAASITEEEEVIEMKKVFDGIFNNSLNSVDKMVLGIINYNLELFSKLPPKVYFMSKEKKGRINFSNAASASSKISLFVELSILWSKNIKKRHAIYNYWLQVLEELKIRGDFFGAYTVGVALSRTDLVRPKKEIENKLNFINPADNFKSYREISKIHLDGFFLPMLLVVAHDISIFMENIQFNKKSTGSKYTTFLTQIRKDLNAPYKLGQKFIDKFSSNHKELLKNTPSINDKFIDALHRISTYEPKYDEQFSFGDIKNWDILQIEKFINLSKIEQKEKSNFFRFLVQKMKIIDGKSLLYQILQWPNKMVDALAQKQSKQSTQNYLNLNLLFYEIRNTLPSENLKLSEEEMKDIEEQNHLVHLALATYKQLFFRLLDRKKELNISIRSKSNRSSSRMSFSQRS